MLNSLQCLEWNIFTLKQELTQFIDEMHAIVGGGIVAAFCELFLLQLFHEIADFMLSL